nr:transmembrane protein 225B-like isoform X1 [Macaca nemestrina]XP_024651763.1 transmembrane protein 225B-like isoform X1 [Macaca nemestrina]XP_024651764.1 transmembrane protein 225B-like isoform X1 [Macaca nemestrina]XP_024651765.1 transmembrane protein 225B-like isoform X1 [Macaca nemestrina]XP_024651766.1 transmembrane protein 225B-like isoform X1 [Macaca nemestrina]XP_024651767.1 transmembrane protein 225B-like isoform X1 [Macaca nemestrina]
MLLHEWCRMKKLNSAMILICNFLAATLLWWSSFISSWVEIELPGDPNVLVSALFMDCSGKMMCWMPKHKSTNFILGGISMISALLLSFCLKFLLLTFPQLFPETQKRYIFCASICIVTGTFVFFSLLMHYIQILEVSWGPDPTEVTSKFPYFINSFSYALFLLSEKV